MVALLAFGTVGFWILLAAESLILLTLIEFERPGWSTFSLVSLGLLLHFFGGLNVVMLALNNPWATFGLLLGYFVSGTGWSIAKWYFYVLKMKERYVEAKNRFTPEIPFRNTWDPPVNKSEPITWEKSTIRARFLNSKGTLPPLVRDNKTRILMWMCYWPWSATWTIINDPVKKAFKVIYNRIHDKLQHMSNHVFREIT